MRYRLVWRDQFCSCSHAALPVTAVSDKDSSEALRGQTFLVEDGSSVIHAFVPVKSNTLMQK